MLGLKCFVETGRGLPESWECKICGWRTSMKDEVGTGSLPTGTACPPWPASEPQTPGLVRQVAELSRWWRPLATGCRDSTTVERRPDLLVWSGWTRRCSGNRVDWPRHNSSAARNSNKCQRSLTKGRIARRYCVLRSRLSMSFSGPDSPKNYPFLRGISTPI